MIVRGDYCTIRLIGQSRALAIDGKRASWHCRADGLDSDAGTGTPLIKVSGANYILCDPKSGHIGTVRHFSLDKLDTDVVYQVSTPKQTFAGTVSYVELKGKTVYPPSHREMVLPPAGRMQSVGGSMTNWGDPGVVKGTPNR